MPKVIFKTDMEEMREALLQAGFVFDGNKAVLPDDKDLGDCLDKAVTYIEKRQKDEEESNVVSKETVEVPHEDLDSALEEEQREVAPEEEPVLEEESLEKQTDEVVEKFQKIVEEVPEQPVLDVAPQEAVSEKSKEEVKEEVPEVPTEQKPVSNDLRKVSCTRIEISRQVNEEKKDYRYIAVSYEDENGETLGPSTLYAYENGTLFDLDVLPNIISGFHMIEQDTNQKSENDEEEDNVLLTSPDGKQKIELKGFSSSYVDSILSDVDNHQMTGGVIAIKELEIEGVLLLVRTQETVQPSIALEDSKSEEHRRQENSKSSKVKNKTLASHPDTEANRGISNWKGLALFLTLDAIAILIGFCLLIF